MLSFHFCILYIQVLITYEKNSRSYMNLNVLEENIFKLISRLILVQKRCIHSMLIAPTSDFLENPDVYYRVNLLKQTSVTDWKFTYIYITDCTHRLILLADQIARGSSGSNWSQFSYRHFCK